MNRKKPRKAAKTPDVAALDEPQTDVFPVVSSDKPSAPASGSSLGPTLPPPRAEFPTFPTDLTEYARKHTGPQSSVQISAAPDIDATRVPYRFVSREELSKLGLDQRDRLLVSLLDGVSTVEMIAKVSGMARGEALVALKNLLDRGVIAFR